MARYDFGSPHVRASLREECAFQLFHNNCPSPVSQLSAETVCLEDNKQDQLISEALKQT